MQAGGQRFNSAILHHSGAIGVSFLGDCYRFIFVLRHFIFSDFLDERPEISVEGFSGLTVKLQVKQKGHKADALAPGSEEGRGQLR